MQLTLRFVSSSEYDYRGYTHGFPAQPCIDLDDTTQPREILIATANIIFAVGAYREPSTISLCQRKYENCAAPSTRTAQTPMTVCHCCHHLGTCMR